MKISFDFFQRKFNRGFELGVYPEFQFNWNNKRYCINADLEKIYIQFIKPTSNEVNEEDMLADFYPTWKQMTEEDPYIMCDYILIGTFCSLDELFENGYLEDDKPIKEIWNEFEFIKLDEDFIYLYEKGDYVYVKDKNLYGIVKEIKFENEKPLFLIKPIKSILEDDFEDVENNWISSEADNLEYDKRTETINMIKESYSDYLYRLSH